MAKNNSRRSVARERLNKMAGGIRNDLDSIRSGETTATGLAKSRIKAAMSKKGRDTAKKAAKSALKFLLTTPAGWIMIAAMIWLGSLMGQGNTNNTYVNGHSGVTTNDYVASLVNQCDTSEPDADGSIDYDNGASGGGKALSLSNLKKFASSGIKSMWGISTSKAESYFLSRNSRVASKYGLNKSNIGRVSRAVSNEGVSPVFFWLYSVNEGGGAGGFINHFAGGSGNAVKDAIADAKYIREEASNVGDRVATGGGEPGGMPTAEATKFYKSLPAGSIGKIYLPATAAATAEVETAAGRKGSWSGLFGPPLSLMYNNIKSLGGDPSKAAKPEAAGKGSNAGADDDGADTDDNGENCNDNQGDSGDLVDGGMNLEQATAFMKKFLKKNITQSRDFPGEAPGSPDVHCNCTVFSSYFITNFTKLNPPNGGNGGEIVDNIVKNNHGKVKKSYTPSVYSVFSIVGNEGGWNNIAAGSAGHTGVILGIDKKKGKAIVGEAMYGRSLGNINNWLSGVNATDEIPLKVMTKSNGWSFVNVNKYLKGGLKK